MGIIKQTVAGLAGVLFMAGIVGAEVSMQGDVRIVFGQEEQKAIRDYYGKEIVERARERADQEEGKGKGHGKGRKGLPPGLAKKAKLPPGIQKQLERGGTLPPGLENEMEPLPKELDVRLKPLPPYHVRVTVGTDVLILDKETRKILDVIRDVAILQHDITK